MKVSLKFRHQAARPRALASGSSLIPSCHSLLSRILIPLLHYVGLSIDISCHISRSHLFSGSDTPSLWVYYLAAVSVNPITSLPSGFGCPWKTPVTGPSLCSFIGFISFISLPVSEDSFPAITTTSVWTPWGNFPEQNPPSITKSPWGVEAPKTFWQDSRYRNICCIKKTKKKHFLRFILRSLLT